MGVRSPLRENSQRDPTLGYLGTSRTQELIKSEVSVSTTNSPTSVSQAVTERHYSPEDLGKLWNVSGDTVRRLFEREPGVLVIERARSRNARRYRTLRIPESVAERVHRRLSNPVTPRII